jgi:ribosome-associated translation inhibitor RaiA
MRDPVEITLRGVPRSAALEGYVGEQARRLERQCDRIQSCQVVAEALHRPKQRGEQYAVRLNVILPGTEVVVNREHVDDVYIALRDAFEAAGLQLKDYVRRQGNGARRARSPGGTPDPGH